MELYAIIIAIIVLIITIINWSDIGSFIIGFLDGLNVENDKTKKDLIEDFRIFYNIKIVFNNEYGKESFVNELEYRYKVKSIDQCKKNTILLSYSSDIMFVLMSYKKLN